MKRKLKEENERLQREVGKLSKIEDEDLKRYLEEKSRAQEVELKNRLEVANVETEYMIVPLLSTQIE